jgi:hypothetical protein
MVRSLVFIKRGHPTEAGWDFQTCSQLGKMCGSGYRVPLWWSGYHHGPGFDTNKDISFAHHIFLCSNSVRWMLWQQIFEVLNCSDRIKQTCQASSFRTLCGAMSAGAKTFLQRTQSDTVHVPTHVFDWFLTQACKLECILGNWQQRIHAFQAGQIFSRPLCQGRIEVCIQLARPDSQACSPFRLYGSSLSMH